MPKKILLFFLLLTITLPGQKKSSLDIQHSSLSKTSAGDASIIINDRVESTLLHGGYFTIGTNRGNSELSVDDKCQITYGHPYALTSHPLISIDGLWCKPEDMPGTTSDMNQLKSGDTLIMFCRNDIISYEFRIINETSGVIQFIQKLTNIDTVSHILSSGIVLDPALGKWGDGSLLVNNSLIRNDTILNTKELSRTLTVWEKQAGAKGIGLNILSDQDYTLIAGNWKTIYKDASPELVYGNLRNIYDLLLKFYFKELEIAPGNEKVDVLRLVLTEPDFSTDIFTRWDLQNYLDMSDGHMFPRTFDTFAELTNLTRSVIDCTVDAILPSNLISTVQQFMTNLGSSTVYQKIPLTTSISYEDKIINTVLKISVDNQLVDELHRYIFIPETPVSDTGLTVQIDSITTAFPKVEFRFSVKNNETGFPINDLTKENVFLFENQERIYNFAMGPDTTGGVNATDLIFALDVTGSMGGTIDKVKSNIVEFSDSLRSRGIDYRLGLVTFLDEIENVYDFTTDVNVFKNWISQQYAHGGGDGPENSLAALKRAAEFQFRTNCRRIVIWITDINYHESDWATALTKNEVINLLLINDITVHSIGTEFFKSSAYDPVIIPTNGKYYDINGNFRDILLDISRMRASGKFIISYNSVSGQELNSVKLEIRSAGRGGSTEFQYSTDGQKNTEKAHLEFYPNPFNPEITFIINHEGYDNGTIRIFNILGECVKTFYLSNKVIARLNWNAKNNYGVPVTTGFYIVQLLLTKDKEEIYKETAKILYMK